MDLSPKEQTVGRSTLARTASFLSGISMQCLGPLASPSVCASTSQGHALGGTALAMWLLSPNWVCRADPSWSGCL
ncbi:hypothetical protein WJX77_004882 [Trebouxia sp. C0004]